MKKIKLILITHGCFGEELIKSAEMIIGKQDNMQAFSLLPAVSPDDFYEEIKTELVKYQDQRILCLVDMFGGSPSAVAARLTLDFEIEIVSGVNLPMLLEISNNLEQLELSEIIELGLEASALASINVSKKIRKED